MKAVIYTRSATDENGGHNREQLDVCQEYALANGIEIISTFSELESGSKSSRTELDRAIELLNSGEVDLIVAYDSFRIARSLTAFMEIMQKTKNGANSYCFVKKTLSGIGLEWIEKANRQEIATIDTPILESTSKHLK
jgi:DNA invertase Pin-like site-specific DNA recombinase